MENLWSVINFVVLNPRHETAEVTGVNYTGKGPFRTGAVRLLSGMPPEHGVENSPGEIAGDERGGEKRLEAS